MCGFKQKKKEDMAVGLVSKSCLSFQPWVSVENCLYGWGFDLPGAVRPQQGPSLTMTTWVYS